MRIIRLSCIVLLVLAVPALGQTPPSDTQKQPDKAEARDNKACAHSRATVGADNDLQIRNPNAAPLSDKLAKSDGVICPPSDVDPEIKAPAPGAGRTPVIPPPGSPGGDPSVRPK